MSDIPAFVLASQSPARLSVLRAAGIDPIVRVSGVDEDAVAATLTDPTPEHTVIALAQAKARAVVAQFSDGDVCLLDNALNCVVVGCDSMLLLDGELQGKPESVEVARQRWKAMAGRSGELLTGHAVLRMDDGRIVADAAACSATTVHFASPSDAELDAYLASGEPLRVAGAFTLDGLGGWFVDRIEGDPSSVIGIGLPLLRSLLDEVGVSVARLWG